MMIYSPSPVKSGKNLARYKKGLSGETVTTGNQNLATKRTKDHLPMRLGCPLSDIVVHVTLGEGL